MYLIQIIFIILYAIIFTVRILRISGQVNLPDVGLQQGVPVKVTYPLDGSKPAQWEVTVPSEVELGDLLDYTILIPMMLPTLQFIIADDGTFFNGTFYSVSTVTSGSTSFALNINGSGLVSDFISVNVTFEAAVYGDLDLTTYAYNLTSRSVFFDVTEESMGTVTLSTVTDIDATLDVHVLFDYGPGRAGRPFDGRQFRINQSSIPVVDDNRITFSADSLLGPKPPPPTISTIGNFNTPRIPLSTVRASQQIALDENRHPILWEINIPRDSTLNEYPRALPLLMAPVSLAFSSNVLDVVGDIFNLTMTLTTGPRLTLMFTSMGLNDSNELENVQILNFNAEATGNLQKDFARGFEGDAITMDFRERTAGDVFAVGRVDGHRMRLFLQYDNKTANPRFTNVKLRMNYSELITTDDTMRFNMYSALEGWNSSCPEGSDGFKCYSCVDGYFGRPINDVPCMRCNCNGHSNMCHRGFGRCSDCGNNTSGRNCQNCADRFYGNATNGGMCYRK